MMKMVTTDGFKFQDNEMVINKGSEGMKVFKALKSMWDLVHVQHVITMND